MADGVDLEEDAGAVCEAAVEDDEVAVLAWGCVVACPVVDEAIFEMPPIRMILPPD